MNLRTHRPAAFDSTSSILAAEGGAGGEAEANAAHQREERPQPMHYWQKCGCLSVCFRDLFYTSALYFLLFLTSHLPVCAAAAGRLKTWVGVRGGEEAAAAAKERERKREEKQRCNTGALGACESAFAALRCAEGE